MKCRVGGRDFSYYCHIHYDDVTKAKPESFWFPLGFSHDWNCPSFVQEILLFNMQRYIVAGGKKNPTHSFWLTARWCSQEGRATSQQLVPLSHPSLSPRTSSSSSVLEQKIRTYFLGSHPKYPSFLSSDHEQLKQFLWPLPLKLPLFMPSVDSSAKTRAWPHQSHLWCSTFCSSSYFSLGKWYPVSGALKPCHLL